MDRSQSRFQFDTNGRIQSWIRDVLPQSHYIGSSDGSHSTKTDAATYVHDERLPAQHDLHVLMHYWRTQTHGGSHYFESYLKEINFKKSKIRLFKTLSISKT